MSFTKFIVMVVTIIATLLLYSLLMSLPVMWLWNAYLVSAVSGVSSIGWLQAWGISILCGFLFKSSPPIKTAD